MAYCRLQSAWTIFSSIASFLWTVAIALAMCWAIISKTPTTADRYWPLFMALCWGLPALVTITALSCDVLGYYPNLKQASWCWIDPEADHSLFWAFFTGKAWELSACLLTTLLYSAIKISLFRHKAKVKAMTSQGPSRRDVLHDANVKLTFVPLVFILLRVWGTIRFVMGCVDQQYASSSHASWVVPLQGMGDSIQGFANFVMYCFFTQSFRERLFRCCYGNHGDKKACAENAQSSRSKPAAVSAIMK